MRIAVIILIATCIAASQACGRQQENSNRPDGRRDQDRSETSDGMMPGTGGERPESRERPEGRGDDAENTEITDDVNGEKDGIRYGLVGRPSPRFPPSHRHRNGTDGGHHNGTSSHHNETSHEHRPHHNESDSSSSHEGRRPHHPRRRGPKLHSSSESESSESESSESQEDGSGETKPETPEEPAEGGNPENPDVDGSGDTIDQGFLP